MVVDCLGEAFPEIRERAEYVATVIQAEEASFGRTLDRGLEIFTAAADRAAKTPDQDHQRRRCLPALRHLTASRST